MTRSPILVTFSGSGPCRSRLARISRACPPFFAVASWVAMRTYATILPGLRSALRVGVCLLLFSGPSWSAEPTLARLSFWVPPDRMAEFEATYQEKVVPIQKTHALLESSEKRRATPDSIFTRLFEVKTPTEVREKRRALRRDPAWKDMLKELGTAFGTTRPDGLIRFSLGLFSAPAGPGKTVPAGPGKVVPLGRGKGHWRTYDVEDGLAESTVGSIFQDTKGNLWFGTWGGGVSRYDGHSFVNFTQQDGLNGKVVLGIVEDREGNLWFDMFRESWEEVLGVSRYDGERIVTLTTDDGLPSNRMRPLLKDRDGNLWFTKFIQGERAYSEGSVLVRFDGQTWTTLSKEDGIFRNFVRSVFEDSDGNLWFGTRDGATRYDGESFITFSTQEGLVHNKVNTITEDQDGSIWFGTDGGISRYDGECFTTYTEEDGLPPQVSVVASFQDGKGYLWFSTGAGVSWYDGTRFTSITTRDGLGSNDVVSIFEDHEGHLWFGTNDGGVSRYSRQTFTSFTENEGLAGNSVFSILQDSKGNLWFASTTGGAGASGKGVTRYDGETFVTISEKDGLSDNDVNSIFEDREGNLWFGTSGGGVSRYDGQTFTTFKKEDGLASDRVSSILQDREGQLWFSGFGVSRYDGQTFTTFTVEDGLCYNGVVSVFEGKDGNLWFGTHSGLSRYDGQTPAHSSGQTWTTFTEQDGLAGNFVTSIFQDRDGILWFGSFGDGLSRYDGRTWSRFTKQDGLASNIIYAITQDRDDNLWFGTTGGVTRYDGQSFQTLSRRDGLVSNGVYSIFEDRAGDVWVGTTNGVTRYRPPAKSPPRVVVDAVVADRRYEGASELTFPSTVGLTTFEFHGRSFKTRQGHMVHRYRLEGHDNDWNNTRKLRVEYQDIPVGDYVFEVLAVDRDLTYSEQPATVKLSIFYQPISATVRISDVHVQDVFASFYKTYAEHSVGSVVVTNDAPDPVDAQVSIHIPELMQRPTGKKLSLDGQSEQRVDLTAILDETIIKLEGTQSFQAEVSLSSEVGDQRISVTEPKEIKVYGRGALTWEPLGRAAAFVTPEDKSVAGFARGLYEAYRQQMKGRRVVGNIPAAMLMFEALNGHGIRYAQDPSTPYSKVRSDRSAIDYIQYPSELLRSRRGDCDDCTVLYCSLLENLNIETAFVDAPDHILMMFDSGVTFRREFGFSLDPSLYVDRNGRYWIPVEVTKLGEGSFLEAWGTRCKDVCGTCRRGCAGDH